jgi:hypothetical protein
MASGQRDAGGACHPPRHRHDVARRPPRGWTRRRPRLYVPGARRFRKAGRRTPRRRGGSRSRRRKDPAGPPRRPSARRRRRAADLPARGDGAHWGAGRPRCAVLRSHSLTRRHRRSLSIRAVHRPADSASPIRADRRHPVPAPVDSPFLVVARLSPAPQAIQGRGSPARGPQFIGWACRGDQPNVNAKAFTAASRNSISNRRPAIGADCLIS